MTWRVVRHNHMGIANILECLHERVHIHYAFVRIDLLEFVLSADNIPKVNQMQLFSFTKVPDNFRNLILRILVTFRLTSQS